MIDIKRPGWVEINLDNLSNNIKEIRSYIKKNAEIMAVIKADAYGHGSTKVMETLIESGIKRAAVAVLSEGMELRNKFPNIEILILGYTPDKDLDELIKWRLTPTIFSRRQGRLFTELLRKRGKKNYPIHINIDTGMHRVGLPSKQQTIEVIEELYGVKELYLEGVYTHFATADEVDKTYTMKQVREYNFIIDGLKKKKIEVPIKHISNSAAILDLPELNYDMVRAGLLLFGHYPSKEQEERKINLKPVMSFHSRIYHIRELPAGETISYGRTYKLEKKSTTGLIPIGYADGYSRSLSNKGSVILKGKGRKVPVVGNICMDQFVVDITGISDIKGGDEVILFGEDRAMKITPEEIGEMIGTISYEVLCSIGKRVPRIYIKEKKIEWTREEVIDGIGG